MNASGSSPNIVFRRCRGRIWRSSLWLRGNVEITPYNGLHSTVQLQVPNANIFTLLGPCGGTWWFRSLAQLIKLPQFASCVVRLINKRLQLLRIRTC